MFLLFGFPLWVLIIELIIFVTWVCVVQVEYYGWSTLLLLVSLASLHYLLKLPIIDYFKENPFSILTWFCYYLVGALIWSFIKWIMFLYKFRSVREEKLHEFHKRQEEDKERREAQDRREKSDYEMRVALYEADTSPRRDFDKPREFKPSPISNLERKTDWDFLSGEYHKDTTLNKTPLFREYKRKIVAWAVFWIPSLIGTLLDDFVRKLMSRLVEAFSGWYQALSNKIVGNFPKPELEKKDT